MSLPQNATEAETRLARREAAEQWWRHRQAEGRTHVPHPLNKRDRVPPPAHTKDYSYYWAQVQNEPHVLAHQASVRQDRRLTYINVVWHFSAVFGQR